MNTRKRNIITGAVVLGALGVLVWMILTFSGRVMGIFKPKGTQVVFLSDRADGFYEGSPVFFKGVEVGKVNGLRRLADNVHILIDGEIDNRPPLPGNLVGEIKAQSSLGSSTQIDMRLDGPPTGALAQKQQILIRYTGQSLFPPEFTDMMEQANKQKLVQHVDDMIVSLQAQVEKVGRVMESVQDVVGDKTIKNDLRTAMANIRLASDRANQITSNLETLTKGANDTVGDVRAALAKTDQKLDTLTHQVGDDLDKLGRSFVQFEQIADKINKGNGTAGALINDPRLYEEMAATAKELNVVATSLARVIDQWEHEGVSIKLPK